MYEINFQIRFYVHSVETYRWPELIKELSVAMNCKSACRQRLTLTYS